MLSHTATPKKLAALERMSDFAITPRTNNILRNSKNLLITLNSLLRRIVYEAGVHPFYMDVFSTNYGILIEQCNSLDELGDIISYIVKSYRRLVVSIQDIAIHSGIPDIHYFTKLFRQKTDISPGEWRKQSR